MGFKLIRIDAAEPAKIPLEVGTHLIGRGSIIECDDQRVSRQHGMIKVTDNSVVLKSLHQNPCFYNKLHLHRTLLLPQGKCVTLNNTDHFGLLPDAYWYELIFCNDDNPHLPPDAAEQRGRVILSERTLGPFSTRYNDKTDISTEVKEAVAQISTCVNTDRMPFVYQPDYDDESDTDTLNLEEEEIREGYTQEEDIALIAEYNNKKYRKTSAPADTDDNNKPPDDTAPNKQATSGETSPAKRAHPPEPSCDAKKIKLEPESPTPKDPSTDEPTEPNTNSQNQADVNTDAITEPQSSKGANSDAESAHEEDTEPPISDKPNTKEVKNEPQSPDDVKDVKKEPQNEEVKKDPDEAKPGSSNEQPSSSVDDAAGAKPPPTPPRAPRERCMYGASCYRRNPAHKLQFSHPGDADHGAGARAPCPYGAACRRAHPRHWELHDHPPTAHPPHQGNPAKKRKQVPNESEDSDQDSPSDLIVQGKRKRQAVQREVWSDSGEEAQDPYATDESDEWVPPGDVSMQSQSQG